MSEIQNKIEILLDIIDFESVIIRIEYDLDRILKYVKHVLKDRYPEKDIIEYCTRTILEKSHCDLIIKEKLSEMIKEKLEEVI